MVKRLLGALVASVVLVTFLTVPEASANDLDQITRMDISVTVDSAGTVQVVNSFDITYASQGHGPYLTFIVRQPYEGKDFDAGWVRLYDYDIVSVTSPTGAPTTLYETTTNGILSVRVGDSGTYVSGMQTYVVTYTITGLLNTRNAESRLDELYWNILGGSGGNDGWPMDIQNLSLTIESPATPTLDNCWVTGGIGDDDQCPSFISTGATSVFHVDRLVKYGNLTVALGFPIGTFPDIPPVLRATHPTQLAWKPDLVGYGAGALTVILALVGAILLARRGRDEQYVGLAPGELPFNPSNREAELKAGPSSPASVQSGVGDAALYIAATGPSAPTDGEPLTTRAEVRNPPVFFTPPADIRPGLAAALAREKSESRDVTATIVDLAIRNYLIITPIDGGKDFNLSLTTRPWVGLENYEISVLNALFKSGSRAYPLVTSQDGPSTIKGRWHTAAARIMIIPIALLMTKGLFAQLGSWAMWLTLVSVVLAIVFLSLGWILAAKRHSAMVVGPQTNELTPDVSRKLMDVTQMIEKVLVSEGYYKNTPVKIRQWWKGFGQAMTWLSLPVSLAVGLVMGYFGHAGWGATGLGVAVFGVGCLLIAPRMPVRTPTGSAMAAQVLGFKKYLQTAEADQIAWEEQSDIFSQYLPYAIGFNCVDRWAKVFHDALRNGLASGAETTWFGQGGGTFDMATFSRSMDSISDSAHYKPTVFSSSGGIWSSSGGASSSGGGSGGSGSRGSSGGGSSGSGGGTW